MVMIMVMMIIGLVDDDNACTKDWSCRLQRETIRYSNDEPLRKKLDEICEKICFGKTIFVCDTKCFTYDYDAYDGLIIYIMTSISLYYISMSLGFGNIDDKYRNPNDPSPPSLSPWSPSRPACLPSLEQPLTSISSSLTPSRTFHPAPSPPSPSPC